MRISEKLKTETLVIVSAMLLCWSGPGYANNLTVQLSNGITTETCADGAACDSSALAGVVSFSSVLGTLTVQTSGTGSGTPALPAFNMDLSYNVTQTAAAPAGTLTIAVSENNLSGTGVQWTGLVNGNQGTGDTTQFNAYADAGNTLFAQTTTLCSNGPVGTAVVGFNCGPTAPFTDTSFSLTEKITITTIAGSTNASGDARLVPGKIPEPASMLLFGIGLAGLGVWGKKRLGK